MPMVACKVVPGRCQIRWQKYWLPEQWRFKRAFSGMTALWLDHKYNNIAEKFTNYLKKVSRNWILWLKYLYFYWKASSVRLSYDWINKLCFLTSSEIAWMHLVSGYGYHVHYKKRENLEPLFSVKYSGKIQILCSQISCLIIQDSPWHTLTTVLCFFMLGHIRLLGTVSKVSKPCLFKP